MLTCLLVAAAPIGADEAVSSLKQTEDEVDKAIDKALVFLSKQQQADGSFGRKGGPDSTAVTSLTIMAFLAKGHTPGAGPYGDAINKGVDFILASQQKESGLLVAGRASNGPMYCHSISTLMLSEVSGMVDAARQKKIDKALPMALKAIVGAQQVKKALKMQGGWRYELTSTDSDISCTGWALMALRSARNSGCAIPQETIDQAMKFIVNCRMPDGGFGYQPGGGSGLARTGTGLLCMELCGKSEDPAVGAACDWILKHLPNQVSSEFFYYALYYSSQGMFQKGSAHWEKFATHMYQFMLKVQQADGSWPQGGSSEANVGPTYSTAMGVLAMSVSYPENTTGFTITRNVSDVAESMMLVAFVRAW